MKNLSVISAIIGLFSMSAGTAIGAVLNVPSQYPTIQNAISASLNGDTVLVADGTYSGPGNRDINFHGKEILVQSENGFVSCVIICGGSSTTPHRAFLFESGETNNSVLSGFTIQNGYITAYPGQGGAVHIENANPLISGCLFQNNQVDDYGGAIYCGNATNALIDNCTFSDNFVFSSLSFGGAIFAEESLLRISNCSFSANQVPSFESMGAGIAGKNNDLMEVSNCTFIGNAASGERTGAGAIFSQHSHAIITDCTFDSNSAQLNGGAIIATLDATIDRCMFTGNTALQRGGAVYFEDLSGAVTRSSFSDNTSLYGGAICCSESSPIIGGTPDSGNDFHNNFAATGADIACLFLPSIPLNAQYNNFTGHYLSDYYVSPSAGYDLSNCSYVQEPVSQNVYISVTGDDANDGLTWETAFRTIRHALELIYAQPGTPLTIFIGSGEFSPSTTGEVFPLPGLRDVHFKGISEADSVLNAEQTGGVIFLYRDDNAVVEDLTISGGSAARGGGLYCHGCNPVIRNCTFSGNTADTYKLRGGGMFSHKANPFVSNCTFWGNWAQEGGGLYSYKSQLAMENCVFMFNYGDSHGGGIASEYNEQGTYSSNCVFINNSAGAGGAINCMATQHLFFNCLIADNDAQYGGGVYCFIQSENGIFQNCTVTGNSAHFDGGSFICSKFGSYIIRDCIVSNNSPNEISGELPTVSYSLVTGGFSGTGNIDEDPLFVSSDDGSYFLSHTATGHEYNSPCINSGSDQAASICITDSTGPLCLSSLTTRIDQAVDSGQVDMGFHYGLQTEPCIHNGDVDGSGELTPEDALEAFQIYLNQYSSPTFQERCSADCNASGSVTPADALCIFLNYLSGSCSCMDPI